MNYDYAHLNNACRSPVKFNAVPALLMLDSLAEKLGGEHTLHVSCTEVGTCSSQKRTSLIYENF